MTNTSQDADKSVNEQAESVLRAHGGDVTGILIRMGFPRHVALPAVDDAVLALVQLRKRGADVASPKAFLVKVATFSVRCPAFLGQGDLRLIHAASCPFRYSSKTS